MFMARQPVTDEERVFVNLVIQHINSMYLRDERPVGCQIRRIAPGHCPILPAADSASGLGADESYPK
jgi:hypothetical protein